MARASFLGPIDQEKLTELMALYARVEQRSVAEHGRDSLAAGIARRARERYLALQASLALATP